MYKNLKITTIIFVLLSITMLSIGIYYAYQHRAIYSKTTMEIGENKRVGNIGCHLYYDIEAPSDLLLISPTGRMYRNSNMNVTYQVDKKTKCITFMVASDEKGKWSIQYRPLHNRDIKIELVELPINQMFLDDIDITIEKNELKLDFIGVYGEPTDTETNVSVNVTISSRGLEQSNVFDTFEIPINTPVSKTFDISFLNKDCDDICVQIATKKENDESFVANKKKTNINFHK